MEMIDLDKLAELAAKMVIESDFWTETNLSGDTTDKSAVVVQHAVADFHNAASSILSEFQTNYSTLGLNPKLLAEQIFGVAFDTAEICLDNLRLQAQLKKIEKN